MQIKRMSGDPPNDTVERGPYLAILDFKGTRGSREIRRNDPFVHELKEDLEEQAGGVEGPSRGLDRGKRPPNMIDRRSSQEGNEGRGFQQRK